MVLHVITGLGRGGAEGVLARLVREDRQNRHEVVSLLDAGVHGEALVAAGVPVHMLRMRRGAFSLRAVLRLAGIVRQVRPDVVQTWMYHADLIGGVVARLLGVRAVLWGVRNTELRPGLVSRSTRAVARLCAVLSWIVPVQIVSCARAAVDSHARIGYARRKMLVIPNGFDTEALRRDPAAGQALRVQVGLPAESFAYGMVARWDAQKDHETLFAAFALVCADHPQSVLVLAGPGITPENRELVDRLGAHGIGSRVLLLGPRADLPQVLSALDCFVLSSAGEGFPNVVAEAMACETPVVVTDVGDAAYIVGDAGLVVPSKDPAALAAAMRRVLRETAPDGPVADRVARGRRRIVEKFSLPRMVASFRAAWSAAVRLSG